VAGANTGNVGLGHRHVHHGNRPAIDSPFAEIFRDTDDLDRSVISENANVVAQRVGSLQEAPGKFLVDHGHRRCTGPIA
jgi:hypothetical protein